MGDVIMGKIWPNVGGGGGRIADLAGAKGKVIHPE